MSRERVFKGEPTENELKMGMSCQDEMSIGYLRPLREICQLNVTQAADLVQISRAELRAYEKGQLDMRLSSYNSMVSAYIMFIQVNNIPIPSEFKLNLYPDHPYMISFRKIIE